MNKNLLMLCFKACMPGDSMVSTTGSVFSTWEFAAARSTQVKAAIDNIPDNPVNALIKYFRAKDCLVSDFSVVADLFEETKSFEVNYDELKDSFEISYKDESGTLKVHGSDKGFIFYKNDMIVQEPAFSPDMNLERIIDLVVPFFISYE